MLIIINLSPICVTDGFLIQTTHLTGTKPTETTYLKDSAAAAIYYDVLSGTPLRDVAKELEKYGRGLRNMGGCSGTSLDLFLYSNPHRRYQTSTWSVYPAQARMAVDLLPLRSLI